MHNAVRVYTRINDTIYLSTLVLLLMPVFFPRYIFDVNVPFYLLEVYVEYYFGFYYLSSVDIFYMENYFKGFFSAAMGIN